jgi:hypothetical protein
MSGISDILEVLDIHDVRAVCVNDVRAIISLYPSCAASLIGFLYSKHINTVLIFFSNESRFKT